MSKHPPPPSLPNAWFFCCIPHTQTAPAIAQSQMTKEQAKKFYAEHDGMPFFEDLVANMSSGPIVALVLAKRLAVKAFRALIGPTDPEKAKAEAPDRCSRVCCCHRTRLGR